MEHVLGNVASRSVHEVPAIWLGGEIDALKIFIRQWITAGDLSWLHEIYEF